MRIRQAKPPLTSYSDDLYGRYDRRLQLLRGWVLRRRGASAGKRFGIGAGVQVWYPRYLEAGNDVTILNHAFMNCLSDGGVRIGDHTSFHVGFWLRCDENREQLGYFHIGSHCLIQAYGVMNAGGGGISIGDHVVMGHMVSIHAGEHVFVDPSRRIDEQGTVHRGVIVEDDCWIGAGVTILDGVRIGRGSVIGAGAVVTRSVPANSLAVGVPARVVKQRVGIGQEDVRVEHACALPQVVSRE
jgi:acetyltransferase-like isoleucine patch superfamily enzyme